MIVGNFNGESSSHDTEHLLQLGMYSGSKDRQIAPTTWKWSKSGKNDSTALCQSTWKDGIMKVEM